MLTDKVESGQSPGIGMDKKNFPKYKIFRRLIRLLKQRILKMNNVLKIRIVGILIMFALLAVCSLGVMLLWNALLPGIFGLPALNYWQAAGLLLLSRILFGGLGAGRFIPRGGCGRDDRLFHHGNPLREKWMSMTDAERKAFVEKERDFMRFSRGFSRFPDFFGGDGEKSGGKDAPGNKGENNE
jgi:hypothetical protein